ncbi:IS256 family transposase [Candidatus Saccharibacteria bacterium]|nr:IS256 family transposase [Candidatus Saccharibacteria bacterium]
MTLKPEELQVFNQQSIQGAMSQLDLQGMTVMSLLQHGSGLLLKEAIAQEIDQHLGRCRYQRNGKVPGHRNGYQTTRIDTPIGQVEYERPKVTGTDFKSQYHTAHMRRPEEFASAVTDMYVNGVSTRKIKDSLKSVTGKKVRMSKSTVSRITKRLRNEFAQWKIRDLSHVRVAYLFLDAIRIGMRMGGKGKDAVLIAYGILQDGTTELLSIGLSHSESNRSWGAFVQDLKSRGLADPLLICSDGNQGLINSIESHFPTSYRQRCVKHREQNILDAVPVSEQGPVKASLKQIFYGATSLAQAKQFVAKFKREFGKKYGTATQVLLTDLDQCLTFYLFPTHHWKRMRTSNKLERLNKEIKRRLKVIGRHPDETGCLSLIYALSSKYAATQLKFRIDDLTIAVWRKLREEKVYMIEQLMLDLEAA